MLRIVHVLAALLGPALVLSATGAAAAERTPVVVGYVAASKGLGPTLARADLASFTHLNIAFANPDREGRFVRDEALTCMRDAAGAMVRLQALHAAADAARAGGAKVSLSIGGGTIPPCGGDWAALLAPARRDATVAALVALVDAAGFDGVDVDLEWEVLTRIDGAGDYTPFVAALSRAMRARGKLLTCATASNEGGMIPVGSIPYFDLVNVMSYDAIGPTWGQAGAEHSTIAGAERDLAVWLARGVPRGRLVLGVPFYGYGFGGYAAEQPYREIVAAHGAAAAAAGDVVGRACAGCRYITYNSPKTITAKARLAAERAAGVMVWELSHDTDDHALTRAIAAGFGSPR